MDKDKLDKFAKEINKLYWENNCLEESAKKWEEMFDYLDVELNKCKTEEDREEYYKLFASTERQFADAVVYDITDYLKEKFYRKENLI